MSNNDVDEWYRHLLAQAGDEHQPTIDRRAARLAFVLLVAVVIFGFIVGASITSRRLHNPAELGASPANLPADAVAP